MSFEVLVTLNNLFVVFKFFFQKMFSILKIFECSSTHLSLVSNSVFIFYFVECEERKLKYYYYQQFMKSEL